MNLKRNITIMKDETEQKILDAALKVFAERGYVAGTTKIIADEAGVSEMTLFRKFETKKNLLNRVIEQNSQKFEKDLSSLLSDDEFEDPRDFLETFIRKYAKLTDDYFELVKITSFDPIIDEPLIIELMRKYTVKTVEYIGKNINNDKIDPFTLTLTINTFLYFCSNDKYQGRSPFNHEEILENFIYLLNSCIRS